MAVEVESAGELLNGAYRVGETEVGDSIASQTILD